MSPKTGKPPIMVSSTLHSSSCRNRRCAVLLALFTPQLFALEQFVVTADSAWKDNLLLGSLADRQLLARR
jgi:hypothetical protein